MTAATGFKFRAFISYSHKNEQWGRWLHRTLEGWRIDDDLAGRQTKAGVIPKTLSPIFRDRDEFGAGAGLSEQTQTALAASQALIVICSPAAARSRNVDNEVRQFLVQYPDRPVIPLIIEGSPGDPANSCFPPSLPKSLLAADAREEGDGRDLAVAKVVARLLGLETDEVFRRAARERRRIAQIRNAITAVLAVLTVVAFASAGWAWRELKLNESFLDHVLRQTGSLVRTAVDQADEQGMSRSATANLIKETEGLFDGMKRFGRKTTQLDHREALMRIEQATNYRTIGQTAKALEQAQAATDILTRLASTPGSDYAKDLARASIVRGDILYSSNDKPGALAQYRLAHERLADASLRLAGDTEVMRALAEAALKIGHIQIERPDLLREARASIQSALDILSALAARTPPDPADQRGMARALSYLGDISRELGQHAQGLQSYRKAQDIRRAIAPSADDMATQLALGDLEEKIGFLHKLHCKFREAAESYGSAVAINRALVAADRSNVLRQDRLARTLTGLGGVREYQGQLDSALESYTQALRIAEDLAGRDPASADRQRELASALLGVAGIEARKGLREAAERNFEEARRRIARLAEASPGDPTWKYDLDWIEKQREEAFSAKASSAQACTPPAVVEMK